MTPATRGRAEGHRWRQLKARIIRRDNGICHLCDRPGADSADHLEPEAHGGPRWDPHNLAAVHHDVWPRCNRIRGDRPIEAARRDISEILAHTPPTAPQPLRSW